MLWPKLLFARNHRHAGAIVAASHYRTDYAGDSTYTVTLSVPPEVYDYARGEFSDALREACIDIVGTAAFAELALRVRTPSEEDDWARTIVESLNARWVPSERVALDELPAAT